MIHCVVLLAVIHFFPSAHGEGILNRLLAPGPLTAGHRKLEGADCLKCHTKGKGIPDSQCLACHDEIQSSVKSKRGFHGLNQKTCIQCHSDHKGEAYDSAQIEAKSFDHKSTGFELFGKHANIRCNECHRGTRKGKPLREKEVRYFSPQGQGVSQCKSCHDKDDPHRFQRKWAKIDCGECHGPQQWREARFDHGKQTGFVLRGRHEDLKCKDCHNPRGGVRYQWSGLKQNQCLSCHDNIHGKNLSQKFQNGQCTTCHSQRSWKIEKFEHAKATSFAIRGAHVKLQCTECHRSVEADIKSNKPRVHWAGLRSECKSCHEDRHRFGAFRAKLLRDPGQCTACHDEQAWKPTPKFDHSRQTRFAIDGKHLGVSCQKCHFQDLQGRPKNPAQYVWPSLPQATCAACHASPHLRTFSKDLLQKKCADCHLSLGWQYHPKGGANFNHDRETRFPLTGSHRKAACEKCHQTPDKRQVYRFNSSDPAFCSSCHANVHVRQFSSSTQARSCGDCHETDRFDHRKAFDHQTTAFPLREKHQNLRCDECHKAAKVVVATKPPRWGLKFLFPEMSQSDCATCHRDVHRGDFGGKCAECHTERAWKATRDFHKNFSLTGVHYTLECAECHRQDRKLSGLSQNCVVCHQQDDVHQGRLPQCGECHRQHLWENAEFKHSLSLFPLQGVHRTLDCIACHSTGIYRGTTNQCVDCHLSDALSVAAPVHSLPTFQSCKDCHNQYAF